MDLRKLYISLLRAYADNAALRTLPQQAQEMSTDDILAYEKHGESADFLVVVNVRNDIARFNVPDAWRGKKLADVAHDNAPLVLAETLVLAPYQYLVLQAK